MPAWAGARAQNILRQKVAEIDSGTMAVPIRTTAPGYRDRGMQITAVDDAAYPKDPAVTDALRFVDQGKGLLIPLWIRWSFLSPSDDGAERIVTFGRHAIGRYIYDPVTWRAPLDCTMPPNADFPMPNQLDRILEGRRDPRYADLPGAYLPWDWRLVYHPTIRLSIKELKQRYIDDVRARHLAAVKVQRDIEADLRREAQPYWDKKLEKVSDVEWAEFARAQPYRRQITLEQNRKIRVFQGAQVASTGTAMRRR